MKKNGRPSKREIELTSARIAGYHGDTADYTRLLVNRRTASYDAIKAAYVVGIRQRKDGMRCAHCEAA